MNPMKDFDEKTKEQREKLSLGMIPIDAVDIKGRQLHQFESVICDGMNSVIMWSMFNGDYVAMTTEGGWLDRESMAESEYVLFTGEEDWGDVEDVIDRLHQTEAVTRLITSHYNMEAMFNEAVAALRKISEESEDLASKDLALNKLSFFKQLVGEANDNA
jgi:hypothetical protein